MKTIYKYSLLALIFFLGTLAISSQEQDWTAESYLLTVNGSDVEITSNLSVSGTTFTWEQIGYNTSNTNTFSITSATGNWDLSQHMGELSYGLGSSDGDLMGILMVSGTSEAVVITLNIQYVTGPSEDFSFQIDTETLNNL